jgi:hypothetical protein
VYYNDFGDLYAGQTVNDDGSFLAYNSRASGDKVTNEINIGEPGNLHLRHPDYFEPDNASGALLVT